LRKSQVNRSGMNINKWAWNNYRLEKASTKKSKFNVVRMQRVSMWKRWDINKHKSREVLRPPYAAHDHDSSTVTVVQRAGSPHPISITLW